MLFSLNVTVSISVCVLASELLSGGFFFDLSLVAACAVVAGAQFSLLKSVQPDASSPTHGYNWVAAYRLVDYSC